MGLLDVHAPAIQSSFDYQLRNPGPAEQPASFNLWSFGAAGFGGIGRGLTVDTAANLADFAKVYQRESDAPDYFSTPDQEKAQEASVQQRQQALSRANAAMRLRSAEMAPDPLSAHRANQVISGVGAGLGRAVGAVTTMGVGPGSIVFGAGEADTAFHEAKDQGVDDATALKLAGTTGVFSAVTAAVPAGGSTVLKTVGLGVATGPASYIANETIAKKILQNANYSDLAAMHDPTDPLGLGLSIALPVVMGGLHIRNLPKAPPSIVEVAKSLESSGQRLGPDGKLLTSPKGAEGEMQVIPSTQTDPGFGVRPAALGPDGKPSADEIARVGVDYIAAMQQRYGGDNAKTLAAYNAGPGRLDAAIAAHGGDWLAHMPEETQAYVAKGVKKLGEGGVAHAAQDPDNVDAARVHLVDRAITDHLPEHPDAFAELQRATDAVSRGPIVEAMPDPARVELEGQLRTVEAQHAQALADSSGLAEPGAVREAKQALKIHQSQVPDSSDAAVQVRAHEIQALAGGKNMLFKTAEKKAQGEIDQLVADHAATAQRLQGVIDSNAKAQRAVSALADLERQHAEITQKLQATRLTSVRPAELRPTAAAARDALMARDSVTVKAPKAEPAPKDMFAPKPVDEAGTPVRETPPAGLRATETPRPEPKPAEGETQKPAAPTAAKVEPPSLDAQRADALIADNPELQVVAEGGTEKVSAAELLQRARAEAQHDLGERDLLRAAVQCALTFGT
jgi:hypothetical protein